HAALALRVGADLVWIRRVGRAEPELELQLTLDRHQDDLGHAEWKLEVQATVLRRGWLAETKHHADGLDGHRVVGREDHDRHQDQRDEPAQVAQLGPIRLSVGDRWAGHVPACTNRMARHPANAAGERSEWAW